MSVTVRGHIVKIGNSQGIRIPKALLEQSGIGTDVEIEVQHQTLVIRSVKQPRLGWEEAFSAMAAQGDDALLDEELTTDWELTEWEW
ncbi:MAG: AbrB/MazE/SpoVT family DNA-binding domain-containing protein [Thermosynechococcaceae cyanobacterium MS004]|nr:AbrB/MazE/SpoVT family DNA-binding domain-containing protein [Thermosynechococcaceae cyanobacterium MS004]